MFCKNCGQAIDDGAAFCPNCNTPVASADTAQPQTPPVDPTYGQQPYAQQPVPPQQPYAQQPIPPQQPYAQQPYAPYGAPPVSQEPASMGLRVLCWFIPIVGIILYFVKKDEKPVYAKQCGKAALISIIVYVVFYILIMVLGVAAGLASSL